MDQVKFQPDREQFEVEYRAGSPMGEEFKKSVADAIIFPEVRRFLGGAGDQNQ